MLPDSSKVNTGTAPDVGAAAQFPQTLQALVDERPQATRWQCLGQELVSCTDAIAVWLVRAGAAGQFTTLSPPRSPALATAVAGHVAPRVDEGALLPLALALAADGCARVERDCGLLGEVEEAAVEDGAAEVLCIAALGECGERFGVLCFRGMAAEEPGADTLATARAMLELLARLDRSELLQRAMRDAGNSMFLTDAEGIIVWSNPAFSALTGYETQEVLGRNPRILKSGRQSRRYYQKLWRAISQGRLWSAEAVDHDKFGYAYAIHQTISPIRDDAQHIGHYLSVHDDVSRRRSLRTADERHGQVDWRSGLLNATTFRDRLFAALPAARDEQRSLTVVSLVIENYTMVTDSLSSDAVDQILLDTGSRISALLAPGECAAALADGEFGLLLESGPKGNRSEDFVAALRAQLAMPFPGFGDTLHFELRAGRARFPEDGDDPDQLWQKADDALLDKPATAP